MGYECHMEHISQAPDLAVSVAMRKSPGAACEDLLACNPAAHPNFKVSVCNGAVTD
jgi:hypothetical protein